MKKFDAIVILGVMLKDDGKISDTLISRLDEGIKFYNKNASKIIMVGGLSNIKAKMTEAEAMKKYALMKV